ncbi:hypothetical protein [Labrys neptuniae]
MAQTPLHDATWQAPNATENDAASLRPRPENAIIRLPHCQVFLVVQDSFPGLNEAPETRKLPGNTQSSARKSVLLFGGLTPNRKDASQKSWSKQAFTPERALL